MALEIMGKLAIFYRKTLIINLLFGFGCLLQGCPSSERIKFYGLDAATKGNWQWIRTTTPTRTITPQSIGYTQQLSLKSDDKGAYVAFYRNDTLIRRENETSRDTVHTFIDATRQTVTIQYGRAGFLKYTIISGSGMIEVSSLMPYSTSSDSVKSLYKSENLQLYPY